MMGAAPADQQLDVAWIGLEGPVHDDEVLAGEDVQAPQVDLRVAGVAPVIVRRGVEDEEVVAGVGVGLGPLVLLHRVLDGEGVKAELSVEQRHLGRVGQFLDH